MNAVLPRSFLCSPFLPILPFLPFGLLLILNHFSHTGKKIKRHLPISKEREKEKM